MTRPYVRYELHFCTECRLKKAKGPTKVGDGLCDECFWRKPENQRALRELGKCLDRGVL